MKRWLREQWQRLRLSIKLARMTPEERAAFEARLMERMLFETMRKYSPLHNMQPKDSPVEWKCLLAEWNEVK